MHLLWTHCVRISYSLPIKHPHRDFIRVKSFELHKTFRTDELSAVYDVNLDLQHIHVQEPNGTFLIFICLTSLLHTASVCYFPFCFRKFSTVFSILERMKTDGANPETLVVRCVFFTYALCSSISGTRALDTLVYMYFNFLFNVCSSWIHLEQLDKIQP